MMKTTSTMSIGALARCTGVKTRTLRFYDRIGILVPSKRTAAGYRLYTTVDEERLRFIRRAQATGLSLAEISDILALRDHGTAPCQHVRALAEAKAEGLERQIRTMEQVRQELLHLAENARTVESACEATTSAICLAFDSTSSVTTARFDVPS